MRMLSNIQDSTVPSGVLVAVSRSREEKLARLRATIDLYQPESRDLAAALVHCALASAARPARVSLSARFAVSETLYRGHVHRTSADLDRRSWMDSRKAPPVDRRTPTHGEISRLAYSYWEARGRQHGSALEDWLRAENDLRKRYAR
jgi:hypothetical protein